MDDSLAEGQGLAGLDVAGEPVACAAAPRRSEGVRPGTRAWFAMFVAWMIALTVAAVVLLDLHGTDEGVALRAWILTLMCFYLSLCNSFVPLPTAWIILLAASPEYALIEDGWLRVVVVAGLATVATVVANLNEYHLLAYLLRFGLGQRVRRTRIYVWALRWFDRAPFRLLALISFVPVPIDAVRWLASLRGYSRRRFAAACFVGRAPRYALFAGCSVLMQFTARQIVLIQLVMVAAVIGGRLVWRAVQARRRRDAVSDEETTIEAAAGVDLGDDLPV